MHDPALRPPVPRLSDDDDLFRILEHWVAVRPDALLFSFLDSHGEFAEQLTYRQFAAAVDRLAAYFQQAVTSGYGSRILLCYQPGLELVCALFACNKAGFVGVPTLPLGVHQLRSWLYAIKHMLDDSQAARVAMCATTWNVFQACEPGDPDGAAVRDRLTALDPLVTTGVPAADAPLRPCRPNEIFFLQYTSGSTTEPKGVMVSHGNLLANARAVVDHANPVAVSWLPQHHDMGLIGYYVNIMLSGGTTYGFSPNSFIKRPALWLETIGRHGATASSIPNFALQLCLNDTRVPPRALKEFDLSTLRFLMVAAEPVDPDSFAAFLAKFAPCGLKPESMFVAYGLAEFTLAVTNYGQRSLALDRDALARGLVKPALPDDRPAPVRLMSCGYLLGDAVLQIVDQDRHIPVGEGKTGEVWLRGRSKTRGYWSNQALTEKVFDARLDSGPDRTAGYLRTGDVGFVDKGELFICGRSKDMLIIHGRNVYPQDIENAVQKATAKIRNNSAVAFVAEGSTAIKVLAELKRADDIPDSRGIVRAVRDRLQLAITELVFLAPRSIARTSSGKIRRSKTRQLFEAGALEIVTVPGGGIARSSPADTGADLDELESLAQRYRLTGDEDFTLFDAGIDSLDLITLLHWFRDEFRRQGNRDLSERITVRLFGILSVQQIFAAGRMLRETPALAGDRLAGAIKQALQDRIELERRQMQEDRVYRGPGGDTVRTLPAASADSGATDILLTGGTGFLGPFLLLSLLQQTDGKLHVLVRSEDQDGAGLRLRREFAATIGPSAPMDRFDTRVRAWCGDLARPQFGLPAAVHERLLQRVGTIYHNGALVNYLLDYRHMRPANVAGTAQVIDFALGGRRKILNHISTTFIFGWATRDVLHEADRNGAMNHLDFGYSQSKWVAEQLVLSAMEQGLSARIFRPALITPALDGRGGEVDITLRLLAFMIRHGICVDTQNQVSFMPVDLAANNIVAIAGQAETLDGTFHVTRDRLETMPQITDILHRKTGIGFDAFPLKDFVPQVIDRCGRDDLLFPLLDFLVESVDNIAAMEYKLYDNAGYRGARDRSPSALRDPPLDDVVAGVIRYLQRKGLSPRDAPG